MNPGVLQSHTATQQWQSFEIRMRRRRVERCVLRASVAIEAGVLDDARAALEEVQRLDPHEPAIECDARSRNSSNAEAAALALSRADLIRPPDSPQHSTLPTNRSTFPFSKRGEPRGTAIPASSRGVRGSGAALLSWLRSRGPGAGSGSRMTRRASRRSARQDRRGTDARPSTGRRPPRRDARAGQLYDSRDAVTAPPSSERASAELPRPRLRGRAGRRGEHNAGRSRSALPQSARRPLRMRAPPPVCPATPPPTSPRRRRASAAVAVASRARSAAGDAPPPAGARGCGHRWRRALRTPRST